MLFEVTGSTTKLGFRTHKPHYYSLLSEAPCYRKRGKIRNSIVSHRPMPSLNQGLSHCPGNPKGTIHRDLGPCARVKQVLVSHASLSA